MKKEFPVVQFEIGCRDLESSGKFYEKVFGWTLGKGEMSSPIQTNSSEGIQGFITSLGHEPHNYINIYIQVDDIADCIGRIEAAGGRCDIGPLPVPDGRKFAWVGDPEGNRLCLITKMTEQ